MNDDEEGGEGDGLKSRQHPGLAETDLSYDTTGQGMERCEPALPPKDLMPRPPVGLRERAKRLAVSGLSKMKTVRNIVGNLSTPVS